MAEEKENVKKQVSIKDIDYKNVNVLQRFMGGRQQIVPRKYTKLSAKMQRKLSKEIKKARQMGLLKYTDRH